MAAAAPRTPRDLTHQCMCERKEQEVHAATVPARGTSGRSNVRWPGELISHIWSSQGRASSQYYIPLTRSVLRLVGNASGVVHV